jgi:hypothetical protein
MKILFVTTGNIYGNSSGNMRNLALIKGLKQTNEIELVVLEYDHVESQEIEEILKGIKVYCIPNSQLQSKFSTLQKTKKSFLKASIKNRLLHIYRKFQVLDLYKIAVTDKKVKMLKINVKYDLVISSSDPRTSHLLAEKIIRYFKLSSMWVQYWGDPMFCDVSSSSIMHSLVEKVEKKFLEKADIVVYTNPLTIDLICEKYKISKTKFTSIPTSSIYTVDSNDETFRLGYFGDYFSKWRNIIPLYEVLLEYNMKSIIVGASDLSLPSRNQIIVEKRMRFEEIQTYISKCNILVVICNDDKYSTQIPGKVFHFGLTNKNVLIVGASEIIKKYLITYNRFYFCDNNENDIFDTITKIEKERQINKICDDFLPSKVATLLLSEISKEKAK